MPDIVTQVYANTLAYSNFDSNGEVTVLTTDGATRYVLKDAAVETDYVPCNLKINGYTVADISNSASGSEIVDINSTVKIALASPKFLDSGAFKLAYVNGTYSGASMLEASDLTVISGNVSAPTTLTTSVVTTAGTNSLTGGNSYNVVLSTYTATPYSWSGYSDGNSTSYLQRNGSTILSPSYARFAYDGAGGYYYLSSDTNIRRYNIATQTDSAVYYAAHAGSTYPSAGFSNGLFFYIRNFGSNTINIYNTATNTLYAVSANTGAFSSNTNCYVTYDQINYVYYYWIKSTGFNPSAQYFRIQSNASNSSFSIIETGSTPTPTAATLSASFYWGFCNYSPVKGYAIIADNTFKLWLVDYAMNKVLLLSESPAQVFNRVDRFPTIGGPVLDDSLMPTLKVRITGVKST